MKVHVVPKMHIQQGTCSNEDECNWVLIARRPAELILLFSCGCVIAEIVVHRMYISVMWVHVVPRFCV
jgi:hypothetical protein